MASELKRYPLKESGITNAMIMNINVAKRCNLAFHVIIVPDPSVATGAGCSTTAAG